MIQKKDSRKCSQQRDNPDNSGTPRTMAGQHRDNSGTIPTTTTDAIATISNLFSIVDGPVSSTTPGQQRATRAPRSPHHPHRRLSVCAIRG